MHPVTFSNPFLRTSNPPQIVAVIPARYQSSRLPGKVLADIGGRPMIEHVYRRTAETRGIDAVVVATDDDRIARAVEKFGGVVRMTQREHRTGTDRIAEVARDLSCEIVINVQGDLPLIEPDMITDALRPLAQDSSITMSTLRSEIKDPAEYANPNVVKVVVDQNSDALYFSRSPIPYLREEGLAAGAASAPKKAGHSVRAGSVYKHIGLYGFRREFLLSFAQLPQTPLERAESLEQLRALELGFRIRTVETQSETIEVDTAEDLERVRHHIHRMTTAARA